MTTAQYRNEQSVTFVRSHEMSNPFVLITAIFLSLVCADQIATDGKFARKVVNEFHEKF